MLNERGARGTEQTGKDKNRQTGRKRVTGEKNKMRERKRREKRKEKAKVVGVNTYLAKGGLST